MSIGSIYLYRNYFFINNVTILSFIGLNLFLWYSFPYGLCNVWFLNFSWIDIFSEHYFMYKIGSPLTHPIPHSCQCTTPHPAFLSTYYYTNLNWNHFNKIDILCQFDIICIWRWRNNNFNASVQIFYYYSVSTFSFMASSKTNIFFNQIMVLI